MDNQRGHRAQIDKIGRLKKQFDAIKQYNAEINNIFDNLDTKMNKLKYIYDGFLADNQNTLFVFGLDSFKFQNRLINEDYETLRKYYNLICNRMYRDYYKLLQLVCDFILQDNTLIKLHRMIDKNKYPKYDYLNVYKFYDVQNSADVFYEIISLINSLNDQSKSIVNQIKNYNNKKKYGLNINNFIYTHAHRNSMLYEQIYLYINYLSFFIKLHKKYFTRFLSKIKLMYEEISNDINFDTKENMFATPINQLINKYPDSESPTSSSSPSNTSPSPSNISPSSSSSSSNISPSSSNSSPSPIPSSPIINPSEYTSDMSVQNQEVTQSVQHEQDKKEIDGNTSDIHLVDITLTSNTKKIVVVPTAKNTGNLP